MSLLSTLHCKWCFRVYHVTKTGWTLPPEVWSQRYLVFNGRLSSDRFISIEPFCLQSCKLSLFCCCYLWEGESVEQSAWKSVITLDKENAIYSARLTTLIIALIMLSYVHDVCMILLVDDSQPLISPGHFVPISDLHLSVYNHHVPGLYLSVYNHHVSGLYLSVHNHVSDIWASAQKSAS